MGIENLIHSKIGPRMYGLGQREEFVRDYSDSIYYERRVYESPASKAAMKTMNTA